jgi:putative transposase
MDNHVLLLVFSGSSGLPRFMRCLLTGYAIRTNLKYKRKGHLFQNRYRSIVCEEEGYLLERVRYIHLNPLRPETIRSMEELDGYPWSGHGVPTGRQKRAWQDRATLTAIGSIVLWCASGACFARGSRFLEPMAHLTKNYLLDKAGGL